jgi:hypothetical protein
VVSIGDANVPQIKINPNNNLIRVGNTNEGLFDINTKFQLDAQKAVVKCTTQHENMVVSIGGSLLYIDVGFQFIPLADQPAGFNSRKSVMALTGLEDGRASIGSATNNMNVVYSKYYYSGGNYIGTLASSDANLKTNIRELPPMSERVSQLRPVMYDFMKTGSGEDVSENPTYKDRVGFIAQEVEKIFPDLVVKMGEDGIYALDYAGLIPYLTKIIQEQGQEIKVLQKQINEVRNSVYTVDGIFDIINEDEQINKVPKVQTNESDNVLFQNAPNPFNASTSIKYQLADNTTNAKICIYNLTGKQLQYYELSATKGENAIEICASSLQSGMYLYSLIVGDKLISTKRMILTE